MAIVLQVAVELGFPGFPRAQQTTAVLSQFLKDKGGIALSNLAVVVSTQGSRCL